MIVYNLHDEIRIFFFNLLVIFFVIFAFVKTHEMKEYPRTKVIAKINDMEIKKITTVNLFLIPTY